jgi:hypothetical protein
MFKILNIQSDIAIYIFYSFNILNILIRLIHVSALKYPRTIGRKI